MTHYYASKLKDNGLGKPQVENYYFVKNKKGQVTVIWFARLHTAEKEVEEFLVNHIIEGTIPQKIMQILMPLQSTLQEESSIH